MEPPSLKSTTNTETDTQTRMHTRTHTLRAPSARTDVNTALVVEAENTTIQTALLSHSLLIQSLSYTTTHIPIIHTHTQAESPHTVVNV